MSASGRMVFPFDLKLLWPLRVLPKHRNQKRITRKRIVDILASVPSPRWTPVPDLIRRESPPKRDASISDKDASAVADAAAASEFASFRPFVGRLLYGPPDGSVGPPPAFNLLKLSHKGFGRVGIKINDHEIELSVTAIHAYVFDPDLLMILTHVSADDPIPWEDALDLISFLRVSHFGHYYSVEDPESPGSKVVKGGGALENVRLTSLQSDEPPPKDRREEVKKALHKRQIPWLPQWQSLIRPLDGPETKTVALGDHRMASMTFLGLPDPGELSSDEWFALSQADGSKFSPYEPAFRDRELKKGAYDRWFKPPGYRRYLAGPMTFCNVMRVQAADPPKWRTDALQKWNGAYYQFFLLAHYQRAALLALQDRIAGATDHLRASDDRELLRETERIQREAALFSSLSWFTEISAQIQEQELYELLKRQLNLKRLFKDVIQNKALLGNWATSQQAERREHWWHRINQWVIPATLGIALLASDVVTKQLRTLVEWVSPVYFSRFYPQDTESVANNIVILLIVAAFLIWVIVSYWISRGRSGSRSGKEEQQS